MNHKYRNDHLQSNKQVWVSFWKHWPEQFYHSDQFFSYRSILLWYTHCQFASKSISLMWVWVSLPFYMSWSQLLLSLIFISLWITNEEQIHLDNNPNKRHERIKIAIVSVTNKYYFEHKHCLVSTKSHLPLAQMWIETVKIHFENLSISH